MVPENEFECVEFALWAGLVDGVDVQFDKEMLDAERFDFALLQPPKPRGHEKKFGGNVPQRREISIPVHLLCDFCLAECGEAGRTHLGRESILFRDEVERKPPAIIEGRVQALVRDVAAIGGADGLKSVSKESLRHFIRCGETGAQIEDNSLDHRWP